MDSTAFQVLQAEMPFTETLWTEGFKNDPRPYARFEHCLTNIAAKLGTCFGMVEMSDHYGTDYTLGLDQDKAGIALAFIIMSAMKAANTYPGGPIDLSQYIEGDLKRRGRY
jgi:hypothetical protein